MKRECCDHCGKKDGDKCADGRMLLVLHLGCCPKAKLCTACLAKRPEVHRHDDESLAEWVKRQQDRKLRELLPAVERLAQSHPFLVDAPYSSMPKVGDFVGMDAVLPELPQLPPLPRPKFVDPLEQLELGRQHWVATMVRMFGRNDPWVKANALACCGPVGLRGSDYSTIWVRG